MEISFPLHIPLTSPTVLHPIKHYKGTMRKKYQRGKYPVKCVLVQASESLQHANEHKRKEKGLRLALLFSPQTEEKQGPCNLPSQEETSSCPVHNTRIFSKTHLNKKIKLKIHQSICEHPTLSVTGNYKKQFEKEHRTRECFKGLYLKTSNQ